jgi:transitional endoplasmic reticulum ATPase
MRRLVYVTRETKIEVAEEPIERRSHNVAPARYREIGGLHDEVKKMRELVEYPLFQPEIFEHLGTAPPRGVLMYGPPGTGKTLMARALATEAFVHFIPLTATELVSPVPGMTEKLIKSLFDEARACEPSLIFIDEIDAIAGKRDDLPNPSERAAVTALLSQMDGLHARGQVVVVAATNRPSVLDEAIRRPGRFERELFVGPPDTEARKEILDIHTQNMPMSGVDKETLAEISHGYVGADIAALTREAAMSVLRRHEKPKQDEIPTEEIEAMTVTADDFISAGEEVGPSVLRDDTIQVPDVTWDDIGGLEDAKQQLIECVEWPLNDPTLFSDMNAETPKGALLYGPPGTGKTMCAKAIANSCQANFISVKGPEFLDKFVGETERKVRDVFKRARAAAPCVLFFDEADAIMPERGGAGQSSGTQVMERTISTFLAELDGMEELSPDPEKFVFVLAASNRPELMDRALLRAGRLSRHIEVGEPNEAARKEIFNIYLGETPMADEINSAEYANRSKKYTGADIANVVREAKMLAIRRVVNNKGKTPRAITRAEMDEAMEMCRPRKDRNVGAYQERQGVMG